MRKILKGAVVLLIAAVLFLSTAVTADTFQDQISPSGTSCDIKNPMKITILQPNINVMKGPTLFLQSPSSPDNWYAYTS